jgi:hypothetical protein
MSCELNEGRHVRTCGIDLGPELIKLLLTRAMWGSRAAGLATNVDSPTRICRHKRRLGMITPGAPLVGCGTAFHLRTSPRGDAALRIRSLTRSIVLHCG